MARRTTPRLRRGAAAAALAALGLAGCASQPKYGCGVPEGVTCMPVSEVYERSLAGALPRRPAEPAVRRAGPGGDAQGAGARGPERPAARALVATVRPGSPVLEAPQPLRVWVNRWVDREGDLHDETYIYLRPRAARWRLAAQEEGG